MGKAKMLGMPTKCVPNSKADERHWKHSKFHQKTLTMEEPPPKKKPAAPKAPLCKFNEGVYCKTYDQSGNLLRAAPNCATCGWNPDVIKVRNQRMGIKP